MFGVWFLISNFSESTEINKKDYFTIKFRSKTSFYEPQLTQHAKKIYSRNTAKNHAHFTNFPADTFLVFVRKTFALHHF